MTEFDHLGVTLCGWQDIKIKRLTKKKLAIYKPIVTTCYYSRHKVASAVALV